jgi:hypothetical protein
MKFKELGEVIDRSYARARQILPGGPVTIAAFGALSGRVRS